jgi:hypothetical protein
MINCSQEEDLHPFFVVEHDSVSGRTAESSTSSYSTRDPTFLNTTSSSFMIHFIHETLAQVAVISVPVSVIAVQPSPWLGKRPRRQSECSAILPQLSRGMMTLAKSGECDTVRWRPKTH